MNINDFSKTIDSFLKAAHKRSDDERKAMFADLAAKGKLRRQKSKPTTEGKSINTKKDNSILGQNKPEEKYTMNEDELRNELKMAEEKLMFEEDRHTQYRKQHRGDVDGIKTSYKKYMDAFDTVARLKSSLRVAEIREKNKDEPIKPEEPYHTYEGITARDIDTTPLKRDPAHEKKIRDTEEWERKHDSD